MSKAKTIGNVSRCTSSRRQAASRLKLSRAEQLHFFTRATSWVDAFAKMERFFDTEVRGASAPARRGSH